MPKTNDTIVNQLTEYLRIKFELTKLKFITGISGLLSILFMVFIATILGIFTIISLSIGLGIYFNQLLESRFLGHFIVSGFYLILIVVLLIYFRANRVKGWIEEAILKTLNQEDESEDQRKKG